MSIADPGFARPTTQLTGGDARLTGGLWTYANNWEGAPVCADGSTAPIQATYVLAPLRPRWPRTLPLIGVRW